jgi:hypothetical protein
VTTLPPNTDWLNKLKITIVDGGEGQGCDLLIDWDETDPDLEYWMSLGEKGQEAFFADVLTSKLSEYGY